MVTFHRSLFPLLEDLNSRLAECVAFVGNLDAPGRGALIELSWDGFLYPPSQKNVLPKPQKLFLALETWCLQMKWFVKYKQPLLTLA